MVTLLSTGMRRGELLELKWQDIDFSQSRIAIRRAPIHLKRNNPASRS